MPTVTKKKTTKITRPRSISELVLDRLRSDIISGVFELGEKISEAQLSELYGVTKAPIRAAYIRLEAEGLLEIQRQAGTFVFRPDVKELQALCELRNALEAEAIRLALARDRAGLSKDLHRLCDDMIRSQAAGDLDSYRNLDTEFHLAIISRASSPLLERTYRAQVNGRFAALRNRLSRSASHNDASLAEHIRIRDSVASGKDAELLGLLRTHIDNTLSYYSKLLV